MKLQHIGWLIGIPSQKCSLPCTLGNKDEVLSFIILARIHVSYWNMAFYMCVSEFKNIFEVQETDWGGQGDQIEGLKEWPINT